MLNLLINARDALDGEGRISVIAENVVLAESEAKLSEISPGEYLFLTVQDEGRGMSADVLARACEPFIEREVAACVGSSETVLVVEDDAGVRATSAELLHELGYKVIEAVNGDAALALLKTGVS